MKKSQLKQIIREEIKKLREMSKETIQSLVSVGDEVIITLHTRPNPVVGKIVRMDNTIRVRTDSSVLVIGYNKVKEINLKKGK